MSDWKAGAIRSFFRVRVHSDIPGRLRLKISNFRLIPQAGVSASLPYIPKAFGQLPGVKTAELNAKVGSLLILYDPAVTGTKAILDWIDTMIETGVKYAPAIARSGMKDPARIERFFIEKLQTRLPSGERR